MEIGLAQNAEFIRNTYRKSVFTGMLSILSVNINVFVDGILLGRRLGPDALAAINLSLPVYLALCILGSFFAAGTEIPAARAIGIGNEERRDIFFNTGLNVSIVASLVITAVALLLREPLVSFLCADEGPRKYVMEYVVITLIGALPKIGFLQYGRFRRGAGQRDCHRPGLRLRHDLHVFQGKPLPLAPAVDAEQEGLEDHCNLRFSLRVQ